jgi:YidC/Oxa1 family membrane protein insertase
MPQLVTDLWNNFLVHPLISLLVLAYDVIPDFGLAVVLVTIALRVALVPFFRAQIRSSRAMQELAPAMNELKKKYGKDRALFQQEQMKLYRERGMNPMAGCLPLLIFLPMMFAMYAAFQQVGGFVGVQPLTIQQLRDNVLFRLPGSADPLIPTPPGLGPQDHLDLTAHWLPWVGNLAHPDLLFFGVIGPLTILSGVLQLVASIQALPKNPPKTDDPMQRSMQSMTYYFPILTLVLFRELAAGVFIYYITTTLVQIVQQYFVMGWGQLARWVPALEAIPTPADRDMRRREQAAIAEAETDMKVADAPGAQRRENGGSRRRGRRRKR